MQKWSSTGAGCSERLWIVYLWRHAKHGWTRSGAIQHRLALLSAVSWIKWLPGSLPAYVVLQFSNAVLRGVGEKEWWKGRNGKMTSHFCFFALWASCFKSQVNWYASTWSEKDIILQLGTSLGWVICRHKTCWIGIASLHASCPPCHKWGCAHAVHWS